MKTDNNPLTYIMTTPNLYATGHQWVSALAKYNFLVGVSKGMGQCSGRCFELGYNSILELETVQAILDGATMGTSQRAERENQAIIKSDQELKQGSAESPLGES